MVDTPSDFEIRLRSELEVPQDATLDQALELIVQEGWEPHLFRQDVDGVTLWACPVRKGIFTQ